MPIEIKPLNTESLQDYLKFFDTMPFLEHPDWSECYCYSYHFTGPSQDWNRDSNRNAVIRSVGCAHMTGYLAYEDHRVIGWCNANDRNRYGRLWRDYSLPGTQEEKICSIVCFLVHPEWRGKGIARSLLEQVCTDYSKLDYAFVEAYPRHGTLSEEESFTGPLHLYQKNGFETVREFPDYWVVRKKLEAIRFKA